MITEGLQYNKTITMETVICCKCGIPFGLPSDYRQNLRNDPDMWFHCPNGHSQHYSESREQRLLREAENKSRQYENQLLQEKNRREKAELDLLKANRKLKRVSKGVCPCCNRTFEDLQRHMKTKHPEHVKQ